MKTTSAPHTNASGRPLFLRVVSKWYSWAGLALTATGSYLALTGQLKFGETAQLRAAAPETALQAPSKPMPPDSAWENKEDPRASAIAGTSGDPFRAPANGVQMADPTVLPEVVAAPNSVGGSPNARQVLDAYVANQPVIAVGHQLPPQGPQTTPPIPDPTPALTNQPVEILHPPVNPGAQPKLPAPDPLAPQPNNAGPILPPINPVVPQVEPVAPAAGPIQGPVRATPVPAQNTARDRQPGPENSVPAQPLESSAMQGEPIPTPPSKMPKTEPQAPAADPQTEDDALLLNRARNNERLGRYREAIDDFERYLQRNAGDVNVRREFAGILVTAGELAKAVEQYERVLADRPKETATRVRLGDAYMAMRQFRAAIAQFLAALEQIEDTRENMKSRLDVATRLARAYAIDSEMVRATQVYERYLSRIRPEDPLAPAALGALLLDLERAGDAVPYLLKQRDRNPDNIEVLAFLVQAFSRLGERERALEVLADMASKEPRNLLVRIALAETLFDTDDFELAGQVYNQLLQLSPTNGSALVGMARVHLRMFQPALARKILDSFVPTAQVQRGYLLTYASYHETVGEYTEAKQIYQDMLRRNPNDHITRYAFGYLLHYVKEWEKAKAEYAKIPPAGAQGRKARLGFADTLTHQRKFQEALEIFRVLLTEDPGDATVVAMMTECLAKTGGYAQAESLARGYLATNPRSEWMSLTVRLKLAKALLDAGKNLEAAREYEIALARPSGRVPESYWGLARASERLGNAERAAQLLACVTATTVGTIRNHVLLADQYYFENEDQRVVEILMPLAQADPGNLAILIRLADSLQRIARMTGQPAETFRVCQGILTMSPTNIRGHLAMARSFAIAQNYRKATVQYDQLVSIDPDFNIPPRERARVLYSDKQYSAARSQYEAMQAPPADIVLQADLMGLVAKEPKLRPLLEPYTIAQLPGNVLRRELPRIQNTLANDPASQLAIQRLLNDYDARVADHTAFKLEQEAKEHKDVRPYTAIFAYNTINQYEPSNTETLFDAGQNYARLKMTREAIKMYGATLEVDPTHRDSMVATERASAEISPKMDMGYSYFYQRGRVGVADIDRHKWWVAGSVPLGDENEYFQVGYARAFYKPVDDIGDPGNIPWFRVQKKFHANRLLAHAQVNVEDFDYGLQARPTFDAGIRYDHTDSVHSRAGLYLENVVESGESIRQDIFRGGAYAGLDFTPSRYWDFGGTYRYAAYSDDNESHVFNMYSYLKFTLPPKLLQLVLDFQFMAYREQTVFPTNPPDPLFVRGAVHPYFSPDAFTQGFVRLEWWHWLSRDYFAHSNQCYYMVGYGIGTDDRLVTYHDARAAINYDCCSWLTIGADCRVQLSSQYDMVGANAFVQIRFK